MKKLKLNRVESVIEVKKILEEFNYIFNPPLQERIVDFESYARKLVSNGYVYVAIKESYIIGFIAFYANDNISYIGYLSLIAVKPGCNIKGIGTALINHFEKISSESGMKILKLEVLNDNNHAVSFYKKNGYEYFEEASENSSHMLKNTR